jgi:hypothetical protein
VSRKIRKAGGCPETFLKNQPEYLPALGANEGEYIIIFQGSSFLNKKIAADLSIKNTFFRKFRLYLMLNT